MCEKGPKNWFIYSTVDMVRKRDSGASDCREYSRAPLIGQVSPPSPRSEAVEGGWIILFGSEISNVWDFSKYSQCARGEHVFNYPIKMAAYSANIPAIGDWRTRSGGSRAMDLVLSSYRWGDITWT